MPTTHPSIGNYFELTAGKIIANDDAYKTTVTADNIVRHLLTAGKTWKEYTEGLPSVGYTGGDTGKYTSITILFLTFLTSQQLQREESTSFLHAIPEGPSE